jgi:hypothetical protein
MYYTTTYPRRQEGLSHLSQQVRQWLRSLLPAPAQSVQIPAGDAYFLNAGSY